MVAPAHGGGLWGFVLVGYGMWHPFNEREMELIVK